MSQPTSEVNFFILKTVKTCPLDAHRTVLSHFLPVSPYWPLCATIRRCKEFTVHSELCFALAQEPITCSSLMVFDSCGGYLTYM